MNKKKINILFLAFVSILSIAIVFISCQKEDQTGINNEITKSLLKDELVRTNQGILQFSSWEAVEQTSSFLNGKSEEQKLAWEDEMGFRSLFGILYIANSSNEKMYEGYLNSGLTIEDAKAEIDNGDLDRYSEYTRKMIKEKVLIEREMDGERYLDILLEPTFSLRYLNKEGFVSVNDTIYQYTAFSIKKITDGDFTKIDLLSEIEESKSDLNISILKIVSNKKDNLKGYDYDNTYQIDAEGDENCGSVGCVKIETFLKLRKYMEFIAPSSFDATARYYVSFKSFTKGLFGWKRDNQDIKGHGVFNWRFKVYSGGQYISGYGGTQYYGTFSEKANDIHIIRQVTFKRKWISNEWIDQEIWTFDDAYHHSYLKTNDDVRVTVGHSFPVSSESI